MSIEAARLKVTVGADVDHAAAGIDSIDRKVGGFVNRAGQNLLGFLGRDIALAAGRAGMALVGVGMDYESSLNNFEAVSAATAQEMERVRTVAKALGGDLTLPATSAGDAAGAMTELAKAGLDVNESIGAAKGTLQLAAAAQTDEANAAKITANALNAYELAASDAGMVADVLAASANASTAEITDMSDSLAMASAVAHMAGVDLDDTATAIGELANKGVKGSDAGTSLKQMLLSLLAPSKEAKTTMEQYGLSVYDAQGRVKPMRDLVQEFTGKLGGLSEEQRNAALSTIFGSDAVRAANIVLLDGVESWDKMNDAVNRSGAAQELAEAKSKGLRGALDGLMSQVETVAIGFYEKVSPAVEDFVRDVAEGIPVALATAGDFFGMLWDEAGPVLTDIYDLGVNVVGFLLDVADAGQPVAAIFAAIAGSGILLLLEGMLAVVGPIAGFLDDNAFAAHALAAGLTAIALSHGLTALAGLGTSILFAVGSGLENATRKAWGLRGALAGISLGTAAIAGLTIGIGLAAAALARAEGNANELVDSMRPDKFGSLEELQAWIGEANDQWHTFNETAKQGDGWQGTLREAAQGMGPWKDSIMEANAATRAWSDESREAFHMARQWDWNLRVAAQATGLHRDEVQRLANTLGVDLSQGGAAGSEAIAAVEAKVKEMAAATGHSTDDMAVAIGGSVEDMEAMAKEAQELRDAMKGSFDSATSIVQRFAGETEISAKDVMEHFAEMVTSAREWATNLQELAHAGIDQGLLEELAIAGPESAALVKAMLDAVRSGNVEAINKAQADLRTILGDAQQVIIDAKGDFETAGWNNGIAAAQGTIDGLAAGAPDIYETARRIAANVSAAMQRAVAAPGQIPFMPSLYGADGGIFDEATPIIIGEAGKEVLLPLTDPRRTAQLAAESGLYDVLASAGVAMGGQATPMTPDAVTSHQGASPAVMVVGGDVYLDGNRVGKLVLSTVEDGLRESTRFGGDLGHVT